MPDVNMASHEWRTEECENHPCHYNATSKDYKNKSPCKPEASRLRRTNRHAPDVQRAIYWASGEIQKASTSLLCRKKLAEPSAQRL